MPIWLRKFTFQKLKEYYQEKNEKEEKAIKDANRKLSKAKSPSYRTRTSNK